MMAVISVWHQGQNHGLGCPALPCLSVCFQSVLFQPLVCGMNTAVTADVPAKELCQCVCMCVCVSGGGEMEGDWWGEQTSYGGCFWFNLQKLCPKMLANIQLRARPTLQWQRNPGKEVKSRIASRKENTALVLQYWLSSRAVSYTEAMSFYSH